MTPDRDERDAQLLGALLRQDSTRVENPGNDPSADAQRDEQWLQEAQASLMAVLGSNEASRASTFPRLREAEQAGRSPLSKTRAWGAAAALAAAALFALSWGIHENGATLTFVVQDADGLGSDAQTVGRVRAPQGEARTLAFSDGSRLKIHEGGSVRVREIDEHGAEVVIENGTLLSSVTHLDETSWSVFAGPYEIEVIGTKFSTNWDPAEQRLIVLLDEGSVRVVGSDIEDHVALKPGQRFEAAPHEAWKVTAQGSRTEAAPQKAEVADPGDDPSDAAMEQPARAEARSGSPSPAPKKAWSTLLSEGKFEDIMGEAKAQGLSACYASCSVARLRALADAARYTGDANIARDALTTLGQRFPSESARASFLLGSLSEARGQAAGALASYSGYLSKSPGGPFAAEARAGKMRALHALGRSTDAQSAAKDYLRLYPGGTSAATARRILNQK